MPDIDYGTRKIVYSRKRNDTAVAPLESPAHKYGWDEGGEVSAPLFILCNSGTEMNDYRFAARKCYCPDCREVSDLPTEIRGMYMDPSAHAQHSEAASVPREFREAVMDADPACPSCGKSADRDSDYVFVSAYSPGSHPEKEGAWDIPLIMQGRYVSAFRDGNGTPTRIDDCIRMEQAFVSPDGGLSVTECDAVQTIDFATGRILSYRMDLEGGRRVPSGRAQEVGNPFSYSDPSSSFSIEERVNVADAGHAMKQCATTRSRICFQNFKDGVFGGLFGRRADWGTGKSSSFAGIDAEAMELMADEISAVKAGLAMDRIRTLGVHPVYSDPDRNGLFLSEHKKDSGPENTPVDRDRRNLYLYMMARYPAAVELAIERSELRVANFEFSEKRKAAQKPDYTAKTATDKARAKFFREEMECVAEQLAACDDKILNEVRLASAPGPSYVYQDGKIRKTDCYESPEGNTSDLQTMKDRLSFFVFGLRDGYSVPGDIAVKLKNAKTMAPATQPTKKLKNSFSADPVAMASNLYTLRKYGITNSDHVRQVLDLLAQQCPPVHPAAGMKKRRHCPFVNAGVLAPVREKAAMSFLRLYAGTHDTSAMIGQIFDNRNDVVRAPAWYQLVENIRLYGDIADNPSVQIVRTKDDIRESISEQVTEEDRKTQLRNYLDNSGNDGIRNAYRDFAGIYGKDTVETVNRLARQIRDDRKMDEIRRFADENGMEGAVSAYREFLSRYEDPADAIASHQLFSDRTLVIATRNNKPLFERDLKEIHDELSEIGRKSVRENKYLKLKDDVLAMDETLAVDLSGLPASQWDVPASSGMGEFSFHVLDNRFDFVRVATDLRNCVASGNYFKSMERGSCLIASMKNEHGQTCACIELVPAGGDPDHKWYIKQLQGYRDGVVDRRYSGAIRTWAENHNIDLERDPSGNVAACMDGERRYFYGGADGVDCHTEEYDPVLNTSVNTSKAQSLRKERIAKAMEIYGGDPESGPALPEVPDDLLY